VSEFETFMLEGFDLIDGWPGQKRSVQFMAIFKEMFDYNHEQGGVCEIGIHHAKYIIALHNLLRPQTSLGIDLFDDQDRNVDSSGRGVASICEENIWKYAYNPSSLKLMAKDSLDLKSSELAAITKEHGYFAMFSVDGGHTALHTANDFLTASKLTSGRGIIIIDDIFHPDWPGVTEGVFSVMAGKNSPFVPLFITRKKLVFSHISVWRVYKQFVIERCGDTLVKTVDFCGWNIPSLNFGPEY
jgi:hypothetical protein